MQRVFPVLAALAALAGPANAQAGARLPDYMAPPYLPPAETVVTAIRAGRLVDVDKGVVLRDQIIVVRGDKIASVEPAPGHVPAGARVIDLSKYTVTPGLIDCHTHLVGADESAFAADVLTRSTAQCSPDSPPCATSAPFAPTRTSRCATTSTTVM